MVGSSCWLARWAAAAPACGGSGGVACYAGVYVGLSAGAALLIWARLVRVRVRVRLTLTLTLTVTLTLILTLTLTWGRLVPAALSPYHHAPAMGSPALDPPWTRHAPTMCRVRLERMAHALAMH